MSKLQPLIDRANEGDFSFIRQFFGDIESFLDIVKKKGLVSQLDIINNELAYEDAVNKIALIIKDENPEYFRQYVLESLSDVTYENGNYYLTLNERGNLSYLFCDTRNSIRPSTVSDILDGEYDMYFDNTTDDVYRDVVDVLEPDKLKYLAEKIIDEISNEPISSETELLEEIAQEQGHPDYVILDTDLLVNRIFNDDETTKYILNQTDTIYGDLYSLHNRAYESAYSDEVYDGIMSQLETFFDTKDSSWVEKKSPTTPNKTYHYFKIKIHNFEQQISQYLNSHKNYEEPLSNYGDYIGILNENINMGDEECLTYYYPDYADWTEIKKQINDLFYDYL